MVDANINRAQRSCWFSNVQDFEWKFYSFSTKRELSERSKWRPDGRQQHRNSMDFESWPSNTHNKTQAILSFASLVGWEREKGLSSIRNRSTAWWASNIMTSKSNVQTSCSHQRTMYDRLSSTYHTHWVSQPEHKGSFRKIWVRVVALCNRNEACVMQRQKAKLGKFGAPS